jgi:hypothetical protein
MSLRGNAFKGESMFRTFFLIGALALVPVAAQAQYLGNYTANPYLPPAPPQPPGTFSNPFGTFGNSPRLYDSQGNFRGDLNANPYDPDSVANPYGRYGSPYGPDSVNNPYGHYGSPYSPESPNNPFGTGLGVYR